MVKTTFYSVNVCSLERLYMHMGMMSVCYGGLHWNTCAYGNNNCSTERRGSFLEKRDSQRVDSWKKFVSPSSYIHRWTVDKPLCDNMGTWIRSDMYETVCMRLFILVKLVRCVVLC